MGTPEFAIPSLKALIENDHEIALIVTQPDRPKGRGKKLAAPPVKEFALENDIEVYQPEKVKTTEFVEKIKGYKPDVLVTVAYGNILSEETLEIAPHGCINVHASLLPRYRGSAPIAWAIVNGDPITGVTTMLTDVGMDTGDMLLKEFVEIDYNTTTGELTDDLSHAGAKALVKTLNALEEGTLKPEPQDDIKACHAPMIKRSDALIDWNNSAQKIHNLVRGMDPWPVAFTFYEGNRMKVWESQVYQGEILEITQDYSEGNSGDTLPGTIIGVNREGVFVQTGDGILQVTQVQFDSSNRMSVADYLLGNNIVPNSVLGER